MRALAFVVLALVAGCTPCLGPRRCLDGSAPEAEAALPGWTSSPPVERIPSYNFDDILEAMRLSYIAYDSTGDTIATLGGVSVVEVGTIALADSGPGMMRSLTGSRALVWRVADKRRVYVAIRGTDNLGDVVRDALFPKDYDPVLGVYVQRGVKSLVDSLIGPVGQAVKGVWQPGDTLWLTGHSLGGAAATLMYLRYYEQRRAHSGDSFALGPLYAFGAVRAFSEDAVGKYRCLLPLVRVVNWDDPVPHLPPSVKRCRKSWDPGCHGTYVQLGDELVIRDAQTPCAYATDQHADVSMSSAALTLVEGALADGVLDSRDLQGPLQDLQMHLPRLYYDKVRAYCAAGARPCTFCCHPDEREFECGCASP